MPNIWFTSDTHFGHKNICRGCTTWPDTHNCRDFNTIEEHDEHILEQINKRVKATDILYHLGDVGFGFAWKTRLPELRARITCETIRLIFGNHDHIIENAYRKNKPIPEIQVLFDRADYLKFGKVGGRAMVFCHYAMKIWPWSHHGSIHLYGHSHSSLQDDPKSLSMDVGVDTCLFGHEKYTPYSIDEIFHIMDNHKKFAAIDHHNASTN
jgi:calcineurin-like phosphoesterase family protein